MTPRGRRIPRWDAWVLGAGVVTIPLTLVAPPQVGLPTLLMAPPTLTALGKELFFSVAGSADHQVSCASCHDPSMAFTDGRATSLGVFGQVGTRNSPSLLNTAFSGPAMWDSRRSSIEDQVLHPFTTSNEHGMADMREVLKALNSDPQVTAVLTKLPATVLNERYLQSALTAYVNSLPRGNSAFDRYAFLHQSGALSDAEQRGLATFTSAGCASCHSMGATSATFTDARAHRSNEALNIYGNALPSLQAEALQLKGQKLEEALTHRSDLAALGRFVVTHDPADVGAFKTPSLRNVAKTAPYFHDGSVPTLDEAVRRELSYRSVNLERPIILDQTQIDEVVAFLDTLDSAP